MKRSREPEEDIDTGSQVGEPAVISIPLAKYAGLDPDEYDDNTATTEHDGLTEMTCAMPPHTEPATFSTYNEYEVHYTKFHTNRCLECRKNFPSEHLLGIHIEECHDPLVVVKRDRGEHTYSCFVEGCERKCMTHQKRRMHMIDKHMYPKNFFFAVTKEGIDGRRSLLIENGHHRRRSSTATQTKEFKPNDDLKSPPSEKTRGKPEAVSFKKEEDNLEVRDRDKTMEDLAGAMSSLQFVPQSIRFGRGRAGFSKR